MQPIVLGIVQQLKYSTKRKVVSMIKSLGPCAGEQNIARDINLSTLERLLSAFGGASLFIFGVRRDSWVKLVFMAAGGMLLHRGVTGHCATYEALGIDTAESKRTGINSVRHNRGVKIERSITISRTPAELYRYWRNFENLPHFMDHLVSVQAYDHRTHWVVKAPAGKTVEWDAEIHNEVENELIAWRSLEHADINNAGSVRFQKAPGGRGTQVSVTINYEPPASRLTAKIAKLWGEDPERQLQESLRQFKQLMETGETVSTAGQPSGQEFGHRPRAN
jgi:uncharacterized membrane protein